MQREIEITQGIEARLEGDELVVKGPKGELSRRFSNPRAGIRVEVGKVVVFSDAKKTTKKARAALGTWEAHVKNMFIGVTSGWEVRLKVVYSHFPIRQSVEGDKFIIHNFLGEKRPRSASILDNVMVELKKDEIVVTGTDIEKVGQTSANLESASRVRGFDRRVFQDGIYVVQKCRPAGESE